MYHGYSSDYYEGCCSEGKGWVVGFLWVYVSNNAAKSLDVKGGERRGAQVVTGGDSLCYLFIYN